MTVVKQGIKVRLYPTEEQEILINKTLGCVRFVYNQTLENASNHTNRHDTFLLKTNVSKI